MHRWPSAAHLESSTEERLMSTWKFSCELEQTIPLPPAYTFPQAFNYLNAENNSFYILEAPNGDYLQLGGSKERCMVEYRAFHPDGHDHYVLGRPGGGDDWTTIQMSAGVSNVMEREVFRHWDAMEFFKRFHAGEPFLDALALRRLDL